VELPVRQLVAFRSCRAPSPVYTQLRVWARPLTRREGGMCTWAPRRGVPQFSRRLERKSSERWPNTEARQVRTASS
jgi:hypothetical protein